MMDRTPYEWLGGDETLRRLVDAFYPKVYADPRLSPLFQGDMKVIKEKQRMFLTQFLGGPTLYSDAYGHPMMRARHLPFEITPSRAEAWLECMRQAMDDIGLAGEIRDYFYERLRMTAYHMVNTDEPRAQAD